MGPRPGQGVVGVVVGLGDVVGVTVGVEVGVAVGVGVRVGVAVGLRVGGTVGVRVPVAVGVAVVGRVGATVVPGQALTVSASASPTRSRVAVTASAADCSARAIWSDALARVVRASRIAAVSAGAGVREPADAAVVRRARVRSPR
ncbi:MAG: hypothetical protein ACRCZP_19420, partial [Phycicoccus sp.]